VDAEATAGGHKVRDIPVDKLKALLLSKAELILATLADSILNSLMADNTGESFSSCKVVPYSKRTVPELIPVLGSQPAGDRSHKPGGRLPLLSARPGVTPQPPSITAHWLVPNDTILLGDSLTGTCV